LFLRSGTARRRHATPELHVADDVSWTTRIGFSLSAEDRGLLGTQFHVSDPRRLPKLLRSIPDGLEVEAVEFAYRIDATDQERERWIRCCECGRDRNHKHGVVLRFDGGMRATVGRDCGREEHSLDFDLLIKEFDGRMDRARLLRQILAALEQSPAVMAFLRRMRADPAIAAAHIARREIAARLPELSSRLQGARNGVITGKSKVRDLDTERQWDDRLERKLEAAARRKGLSRDDGAVDRDLLAELAAGGDADASKKPIHKLEDRRVHSFDGQGFYSLLPQAGFRAERLEQRLQACFGELRGKESAAVADRRMAMIRKEFFAVLDEALKLHGEVVAALTFAEPGNLAAIVRAHNRFYRDGDARTATCDGRALSKLSSPGTTVVDLALPAFTLATGSLDTARERVMDAFGEDGRNDGGEIAA